MYKEILSNKQLELLPTMATFRREYYLVGGTAIALHLGHRRSIDFDLFKPTALNHKKNLDRITDSGYSYFVTRRVAEQMNLIVNDVKVTFFQYPFPVQPIEKFESYFRMPSLLQLAAMKAYALRRRSKWKDYVDLFFLLKEHFSIAQISECATTLFGDLYSEKMFRAQLCYFEDVDYTEEVDYLTPNPPSNEEIRNSLTEIVQQGI
ncbi:MAG: nucleotidyl transferase AbiEii/AbiGii toxin family protein [Bacteroidales bacterium]|nr:nucleotidyl transferase AbiEii/AbiGii toxin family protein [Candidatus Colimorpha pelethequi]